jgi:NADP-dependent 3-hydroxy acid dehydrogenase YdfG
MPAIAIVGAGPGLGLSIARVFGAHRFDVALISRNAKKLEGLVAQLTDSRITAAAFPADVADRAALTVAVEDAIDRFDGIDVLEYSPYSGLTTVSPLEVTVENLRAGIEHDLYGAVTPTRTVLPSMLAAGTGTLLFTTGAGAINPYPMLATMNAAQAARRNWVLNLNNVLAEKGIYAANLAIGVFIGTYAPEGVPSIDPDLIASAYWDLHITRAEAERVISS